MATKAKNTAAYGHAQAVAKVLKKIKRMQNSPHDKCVMGAKHCKDCAMIDGNELRAWISEMDDRMQAKAGGLGRK